MTKTRFATIKPIQFATNHVLLRNQRYNLLFSPGRVVVKNMGSGYATESDLQCLALLWNQQLWTMKKLFWYFVFFFVNLWIDCVCYLFAIYLKCWRKLLPTNVFSLLLTKREKREALSQFRGSRKFFESAGSRDLRTRSHWRNMRICCC